MKRVALVVVGGALTLAGVALLVLPGPGFVFVAAGLALLATQFTWAARPLDYAKDKARTGIDELGQSRLRAALAVLGAVGVLAAGVLEIVGVDLPLVNLLTASLLILSGLALLATIVYARRRTASGGRPGSEGDRLTAVRRLVVGRSRPRPGSAGRRRRPVGRATAGGAVDELSASAYRAQGTEEIGPR